jgi:5'-nucleotidase/UDP-sugar diphosphatase
MHPHPPRRRGGTALSTALLALLLAVGLVVPAAAAPPEKPAKVDFTLTVLHNNDGESDLLPDENGAGSISRFGWLLEDLRRDATRGPDKPRGKTGTVTITSGDNFLVGPELQASLDKGIPWYDAIALEHIGYDAFIIGNHEFDLGPQGLADFINSFSRNDDLFLSANLDFSQVPELQVLVDAGRIQPSTIVKERGELIGIIGLTTPELREVTSPGATIIDEDLVAVVQAEIDALTAQGVDKILLSSHLQAITNEVELVASLSGVDAVIGGGGGEDIRANYPIEAIDADGNVVPVVTVPGDYFDVGRLVLEFNRAGEVIGYGGALEPVTGDLPQDQFLVNNVEDPITAYLETLAETVIATTEVGLNGVRADVRTRETNLGDLMTDAWFATATDRAAEFGVNEPDVALQNGGGIRNDSIIGPGDVTLLDTFDIAPFPNFISVLEDVAADDFVAAVEHGLSAVPVPAGSFAQWSGLTVTYDPGADPGSRIIDLVLDDGTVVVSDGTIVSSEPVTIATIDFLAAGNDGYDMFEAYDFTTLGISYQQALADYLAALGTVTAAEYPDTQTRIVPGP